MPHPLAGARAKIERAAQHLAKLYDDTNAFVKRAPYAVAIERDRQTGQIRLLARDKGLGNPPIDLTLLAGELVYQLRSALDHTVHQLVLVNHQTPTRRTQFPIFETLDGYVARAGAMIKGVSASAETIIESVQPYHRGATAQHDPLWVLQDLNNTDKHRLIPLSVIGTEILTIGFPNGEHSQMHVQFSDPMLKDGAELCHFALADLEVQMKVELICAIAFHQIAGLQYQPVVPFLTQALTHVSSVVESFASEFP